MEFLINSLGLGYVVSWGLSYYPQLNLNYKNKSTQGLSMDFVLLNVTGYLGYVVYNYLLVMNSTVRETYMENTGTHGISARGTDLFFAIHGFILTILVMLQCFYYSSDWKWYHNWTKQGKVACIGLWCSLSYATWCLFFNYSSETLVLFLRIFGNVKLIVTFMKYPPQMYFNYKRQSTAGWSITYSWLDSLGGLFSVLQMLLLYYQSGDSTVFSGNFPKLGLGTLSLLCNSFLLVQHYIFYKRTSSDASVELKNLKYIRNLCNHVVNKLHKSWSFI